MIVDENAHTLIRLALSEDLGEAGDLTSQATLPLDKAITGRITVKSPGVIAGLAMVSAVYEHLDGPVVVKVLVDDSVRVQPGDVVCEVTGPAGVVLSGERVAINFLQRLSGIATLTAQFVDAVAGTGAIILDTRKTTPGWRVLEKYAVRMGGGRNHRMGLFDMVLVKDNHIDAAGGIRAAAESVRAFPQAHGVPVEIEVKSMAELAQALAQQPARILLDNMTPDQLREAVLWVNGRVPLEASGGVSLETVRIIAETGVDYISVGALTHSAHALDLSMRLVERYDENASLE